MWLLGGGVLRGKKGGRGLVPILTCRSEPVMKGKKPLLRGGRGKKSGNVISAINESKREVGPEGFDAGGGEG